jgi:hypothetical protein
MNFTDAIITLIHHLPWLQGAPTDGVRDQPREDHPGTTFLNGPRRGLAAKSHGSFDSVASSSSTVSSKSDDSFATALEEAEDAHLTTEEAANYLKNVLGIEKNPTDGTSLKTPNGDAQGEMTMVTHGQPWITVTRPRTMRVKAEQRPPKVGVGRACQNWRADTPSMISNSSTGTLTAPSEATNSQNY